MKFSIKDFFNKCDQIRRKLRIWSHLLTKSLVENFIFCAVQESLQVHSKRILQWIVYSEVSKNFRNSHIFETLLNAVLSKFQTTFFLKHQLTPLVEWNGNLREGGIAAEWYSCWKMSIFEKKSFEEGIKFLEYWYFDVDADANVDPDVEISMLRWLRSSPKN